MSNRAAALALAARCKDAFSARHARYGSWDAVAKALLDHGLTEIEAEAVMRSKWARLAADSSAAEYGKAPARVLVDFVIKEGPAALKELVEESQ